MNKHINPRKINVYIPNKLKDTNGSGKQKL